MGQELLVIPQVGIDFYPNYEPPVRSSGFLIRQVTEGDLHGNTLKLLHILVRHGMLGISFDDYDQFTALYFKKPSKLKKKDFDEMADLIARTKVTKRSIFLRLLGDEFSDRGQNDYFTMLLLEKLKNENLAFESILSNHGFGFIRAMEIALRTGKNLSAQDYYIGPKTSLFNLEKSIEQGFVQMEKVVDFYQNVYLPSLKLLSYVLDNKTGSITLNTHAPAGLNNIKNAAGFLRVEYRDETGLALAQTIDRMNEVFQEHAQRHALTELVGNDLSSPLNFLMWNREYKDLNRPHHHNGYEVNWAHGHDPDEPLDARKGVFGLDNSVGKEMKKDEEYDVYFHPEENYSFLASSVPHSLAPLPVSKVFAPDLFEGKHGSSQTGNDENDAKRGDSASSEEESRDV